MPRPSLKAQRSNEILDAFERCVARYGVEGATLERTAEEAGLQRSLIRHNVGNRDDLLNALVDRFLMKSTNDINELVSESMNKGNPATLIEYLFDESYSDKQSVLVVEALIAATLNDPEIAPRLQKWIDDITKAVVKTLRHSIPNRKAVDYRDVATGIVGIYFNIESLSPLGAIKTFRKSSKNAAMRLVNTLG